MHRPVTQKRIRGDEPLFLMIQAGSEKIKALIDTGASDCFISAKCRRGLDASCIHDAFAPLQAEVSLANNSKQSILETVRLQMTIAGSRLYFDFNVVEGLCHPMVVGRNLLTALRSRVSLPEGIVEVFCGCPVSSRERVILQPGTEAIIRVGPWRTVPVKNGKTVYCAPTTTASVVVEGGVNTAGRPWWLKILNPLEKPLEVRPGDVLAFAEAADAPTPTVNQIENFINQSKLEKDDTPLQLCHIARESIKMSLAGGRVTPEIAMEGEEVSEENSEETRAEVKDEIDSIEFKGSELTEDEQKRFKEMLRRNRDSLAFSLKELGECNISPMKIRVDESEGIVSCRPYRYSPQKMDTIDEQVRQLIDLGVIEPSVSAWRSPLVVVQKKDGKPRLCTDFRMLNTITVKDKFPMPTARSLFLYMAYKKPTIWSALDLLSGYHQCVIEPESRPLTAFETPMGIYQYRRVAFGLVGAPWHFTKVMSIALRGLIPRICLAYLDDVIVYDSTFEEHLRSVELVLQALGRAGLRLKPSKCEWAVPEINFLGHKINKEGIKTQPQIIERVKAFRKPHNVKTVKSFLGLCNYYREFIPGFAETSVPLNELLRKGIEFKWSAKCEEAFQKLKTKLIEPPLLIHPKIGGHFTVLTDASDTACGAAICHEMDGKYRPVAFWGYTLRDAELNYTVTEKEALAVVKGLKHHEDMLQGARVTIITDHKPLIPLLQQAHKAPSVRLRRWALALTNFDFDIKYEPGATHFLPDYLSRLTGHASEDAEFEPTVGCELLAVEVALEELDFSMFMVEQGKDQECSEIIRFLRNDELPVDEAKARVVLAKADTMAIVTPGVLCKFAEKKTRRDRVRGALSPRIVVPNAMRGKIMKTMHDDILNGGHVGVDALSTKITNKYYWKGMYEDILQYVRACRTCALRKRAPHFKAMAKSWDRPSRAWQWVQCDFIGPLKKAIDGSKYIMTFIDLLTGWPEAFCTKDSTAATAAKVFLQEIVCRYGRVERLHTDRGATFLSDLFREVTTRVACKQTFTTGRMPTGNARVERMHKTLENIIGCYISEDHREWPSLVPVALWTLRSTISGRTGFAPYTLLFGTDPVGMGFPEYSNAPDSLNENEAFLEIRDQIGMFRHLAKDVTDEYEKGMRQRINERANPALLYDGDLVYMYDPLCAENRTSKFSDRYRGPFRIIRVIGDNLVRLISVETGKIIPHLVNVAKLKRAHLPWNPIVARPVQAKDLEENELQKLGLTAEEQNVEKTGNTTPGHPHDTMAGERALHSESDREVCDDDLTLVTRNGASTSSTSPVHTGTMQSKPCTDRQEAGKPRQDGHDEKPCTEHRPSRTPKSGRPDRADDKPSTHEARSQIRQTARRGRPPGRNAKGIAAKTPVKLNDESTISAPEFPLYKQADHHDYPVTNDATIREPTTKRYSLRRNTRKNYNEMLHNNE